MPDSISPPLVTCDTSVKVCVAEATCLSYTGIHLDDEDFVLWMLSLVLIWLSEH